MNLNYIKNAFKKYENEDFSNLLEKRKSAIKLFTLPLSILVGIVLSYLSSLFFDIQNIIQTNDYFHPFLILWIFLFYHCFKQPYLIIRGLRAYQFDNNLKEKYPELTEIFDKFLFLKYRDTLTHDNPFPYFLTEFKDIDDKEINSYLKSQESALKVKTHIKKKDIEF